MEWSGFFSLMETTESLYASCDESVWKKIFFVCTLSKYGWWNVESRVTPTIMWCVIDEYQW